MNLLDPDHAEEEFSTSLDVAIPTRGYRTLPTVGIGGSAGCLSALQRFFATMPADPGMAFVVVVHLSSEHDSALAEILQRSTAMPVVQVTDTQCVEANHVYVIAPRKGLAAMGDELRLADLAPQRGHPVAVDMFFRTLADTYGPHAIAVVLSGALGDGSIGIRRIKERGGLTVAQDPAEAEHSGMPRSAIATGLVDWVLPAAEIGPRLVGYQRHEKLLKLPPEATTPASGSSDAPAERSEAALREAIELLRSRTGRDFSRFNRPTLIRRIGRRLQIHHLKDISAYLGLLRQDPAELLVLRNDLLASVTNFFRDGDAFAALAALVPTLFADKGADDTVRVWCAGCATGEEAYSIAMLLAEHARSLAQPPKIQVFATDLDANPIRIAREALYSPAIAADVSPGRLTQFFLNEVRGYRVRPELRETVLFAVHDLLSDAPFARIDLVSCRNVLISLDDEARRDALGVFAFALRPNGLLLLGPGESVEAAGSFYTVADARHRLYRTRVNGRHGLVPGLSREAREALQGLGAAPARGVASAAEPEQRGADGRPLARSELHFQLIERFAPPSLVVDGAHNVVHLSERAGRFLKLGGGEPSRDLLQLVHPMLRIELRAALQRASESGDAVEVAGVPIEIGERATRVDISVSPADEIAPGCHLVVLAERPVDAGAAAGEASAVATTPDERAMALDRELDRLRAHLRHTVEQYEVSTEELKAGNEELQAINEELRSASEELETSREELQSINEELSTVNLELRSKIDEVRASNSDLHNLMGSIATPTVFLDSNLQVTLYTPSAVELFTLIASDVGRPLADLAQRLDYAELQDDARQVLKSLVPVTREVGDTQGRSFLARIAPYRTLDEHIAGVVLTFTEVSALRTGEAALRESRNALAGQVRLFQAMFAAIPDAICTFDRERRFIYANAAAEQHFGLTREQIAGRTLREAGCGAALAERLERHIARVFDTGASVGATEAGDVDRGARRPVEYFFAPVPAADGGVDAVVGWSREASAPRR